MPPKTGGSRALAYDKSVLIRKTKVTWLEREHVIRLFVEQSRQLHASGARREQGSSKKPRTRQVCIINPHGLSTSSENLACSPRSLLQGRHWRHTLPAPRTPGPTRSGPRFRS